mgnify:CR=1 FL=1
MKTTKDLSKLDSLLEPFDPSYITGGTPIEDLSASEKRFCHKVSILYNKMRRLDVNGYWNGNEFEVERYMPGSEYPIIRYLTVNMDTNDYSFGTEKEDLVYSTRVTEVVEAAKKWCNAKFVRK